MSETKHELILKYIEELEIGAKVSVRQIAKALEVSEGTAYRAMKQAENLGLVSSIPKVATIRIEAPKKKKLEDMTLHEINLIVEGSFLSGLNHVNQIPKRFIVGFSVEEAASKQLNNNTLLIAGNLPALHEYALRKGAAVLVTGGNQPAESLLHLAKEMDAPLLCTPYDAFVAISMINKAIYERLVQQDLVRIGDIMNRTVDCLFPHDTVLDWHELAIKSGHSNFPVINGENILLGVVSALDVTGMSNNLPISEVMNTEALAAQPESLVSHISRLLVWEDCDMIPVVDEKRVLVGIVNRQDIIQALQQTQKQPQFGETVDNLTLSGFKLVETNDADKIMIRGKMTQFMLNEVGFASSGALTMIISNSATIAARKLLKLQTIVDDMYLFCLNRIQINEEISASVTLLHADKKACKAEVIVATTQELKYKAILSLKVLKK